MTGENLPGSDDGDRKYLYLSVAAVAIVSLFLGFLWGSQGRAGKLTLGEKGVEIEIANRERIESIIDKVLSEGSAYERRALVSHIIDIVNHNDYRSDIGRLILEIAEKSHDPFRWDYEEAEVRFDASVPNQVFYVCRESERLRGHISVQIENIERGEFIGEGKLLFALPAKQCGASGKEKNIIYTNLNGLALASKKPGHVAKARPVVMIPK